VRRSARNASRSAAPRRPHVGGRPLGRRHAGRRPSDFRARRRSRRRGRSSPMPIPPTRPRTRGGPPKPSPRGRSAALREFGWSIRASHGGRALPAHSGSRRSDPCRTLSPGRGDDRLRGCCGQGEGHAAGRHEQARRKGDEEEKLRHGMVSAGSSRSNADQRSSLLAARSSARACATHAIVRAPHLSGFLGVSRRRASSRRSRAVPSRTRRRNPTSRRAPCRRG
jgi:hypothetical protein